MSSINPESSGNNLTDGLPRFVNWLYTLFVLAFVRRMWFMKDAQDAAANTNSDYNNFAAADTTYANVRINGAFTTDGTDYFTIGVQCVDPATGAVIDTASASFASTTAAAGVWASKPLSPSPFTVKKGTLVRVSITKAGAGVQLPDGAIQLYT